MNKVEMRNPSLVRMDFSGIYDHQSFYRSDVVSLSGEPGDNGFGEMSRVDLCGLSGTNCYCDDEAMQQIREAIREFPAEGIHFVDSGNYHYMSRIWLEKVTEPFRLVVFDNHTDMQPPAFGGILSCGGWIAAALEELPFLKEVILIGPDEEAYRTVDSIWKERVTWVSREQLAAWNGEELYSFLRQIPTDLPVYLSIDKDVLSQEELKTNWSQGDLRFEVLLQCLVSMEETVCGQGSRILGMDVCGECDVDHPDKIIESDRINSQLLAFWLTYMGRSGR
jgi:arginase family enzyme